MDETGINRFLTLDDVVRDSDALICTGCEREGCVHEQLGEQERLSINEAMDPDAFVDIVRCLARVVRRVCKKDSTEVPKEFVQISRMSNLVLRACQEYGGYTNGHVTQWDGDVRLKLYGNRHSINLHL